MRAGFAWHVNRALLNRAQPALDRDSRGRHHGGQGALPMAAVLLSGRQPAAAPRAALPGQQAFTVARPVAMSAACTLTWSRCHSGAHYMLIARIKSTSRYHAHRAEEQLASGKCTPAAESEKTRPIPAAAYPNRRSGTRGGVRNRHPASPHAWSGGKRRVRSPATLHSNNSRNSLPNPTCKKERATMAHLVQSPLRYCKVVTLGCAPRF